VTKIPRKRDFCYHGFVNKIQKLLRTVKKFYKKHKRNFPWRHTRDPYQILVSEIMLQQTQASRVVPFYTKFVKKFPTAKKLAKAPLSKVLKAWQGLGYNRRAKFLHQAAKIIVREGFGGRLPGVGPYTVAAVDTFAHNKPEVFIETNIRTVFTHFYFSSKKYQGKALLKVEDSQILPLIAKALKKSKMQPRDFYAALMDYGAFLKASGIKLNARSKHYTKQSKFKGSARQLRGAILRELLKKPSTLAQLTKNLSHQFNKTWGEVAIQLKQLEREGLIVRKKNVFATAK
jgi:A/G-specific adenine glycosylase